MTKIDLTPSEALVLFDWLSDADLKGDLAVDDAEIAALDGLLCSLEKVLVEPFQANYGSLVETARAKLKHGER